MKVSRAFYILPLLAFLILAPFFGARGDFCSNDLESLVPAGKLSWIGRLTQRVREFPINLITTAPNSRDGGVFLIGKRFVSLKTGEVPVMATRLPIEIRFTDDRPRFVAKLQADGEVLEKPLDGPWSIAMSLEGEISAVPPGFENNIRFPTAAFFKAKIFNGYIEEIRPLTSDAFSVNKNVDLNISLTQLKSRLQKLLGRAPRMTIPVTTRVVQEMGILAPRVVERRLGPAEGMTLALWLKEIERKAYYSQFIFEETPERDIAIRDEHQISEIRIPGVKARYYRIKGNRWIEEELPASYLRYQDKGF